MHAFAPRGLTMATAVVAAIVLAPVSAASQDWPQFLGVDRDGRYPERVGTAWTGDGPRETWRREVGAGFAGPVVSDGRLILFHRVGGTEVVEALEAETGRELWRHESPTTYRDDFGFDEGPRSAPVVSDGRVVTFGAQGVLQVLDVETGRPSWSVETHRRYGVRKGFFGAAGVPLVTGGLVIANVGGPEAGIVAFDVETGEERWVATRDEASYSSGVAVTLAGEPLAVFLTRNLLVGLDPRTGAERFREAWRARLRASVNAATPMVVDDLVFVSAEYGPGAGVFRMGGEQLEPLWRSNDVMSNHYATSVHHDGTLYGYHGRQEFGPSLRAVDLQSGTVHWSEDRFGAGAILVADDQLVVMRESGELVVADASPEGFAVLARAQVLPGVVRAYPALASGRLYVRNTDTLVSLDLSASSR